MKKSGEETSDEIVVDIGGFNFVFNDFKSKGLIPEYFNTPFITPWEITRQCNLNCMHCLNNSGKKHPNELTHKQRLRVARELVDAKIYRACLSGGEPILCESFWDIAKILKDGHVLCNTITNGLLVNEENAPDYAKYFDIVQVSLDGATAKTHDKIRGRKGSFEKAVNAAKLIAENGTRLSIASVAVSPNIEELGDLADIAYDAGAQIFRSEPVKLVGRAAINKEFLRPSKDQIKRFKEILQKKQKEYSGRMLIEIIPEDQGEFVIAEAGFPPIVCYISPTGTCAPHPVFPYSGGSLKEKSFLEVWDELKVSHNSKEYQRIASSIRTNEDFLKMDHIPYVEGELHDR